MQTPLLLAGFAMGVAATPHCAAMCAAPCASIARGGRGDAAGFQFGRVVGYAAGGALAAASVSALAAWSAWMPAVRPLWLILHLVLLGLGLWWIATGHQPEWMRRDSAVVVRVLPRRRSAWRAGGLGLAWVAWPCGALHAALLLAALADGPLGGAAVMAAFAVGSMPALAAAPWVAARWRSWGGPASVAKREALGLRIAGAGLVVASGWAMTQGLWTRVAAWCGF